MYKFINFPKSVWINIYIEEEERFLDFCKKEFWNQIISIYSIWSIELIWLSDLDYLIIWLSDLDFTKIVKFFYKSKFKFIDKPRFISIDNISNISYFTHRRSFKLIYWKNIKFNFIINENLNLLFALKILFSWVLRIYYPMLFSKKIDISLFLMNIKDLISLNKLIPGALNSSDILFLDECYNLYNLEFDLTIKNRISNYFLPKIIDIWWKYIFYLNKKLKNKSNFNFLYNQSILWRYPTFFSDYNLREKTEIVWNKFNYFRILFLPISFNFNNFNNGLKEDFIFCKKISSRFFQTKFNILYLDFLLYIRNTIIYLLFKFFFYEKK